MNTRRLFTRLLLLSLLLQAVPSASLSALAQAANPNIEQVLAATLTVNSTADPGDGICDSTECTLREAIASAAPGAVIDFSLALPATINLVREQLLIAKPLTINGPGRDQLKIKAVQFSPGEFRLLRSSGSGISIKGMTMSVGMTNEPGGGIYNTGELKLQDVVLSNNMSHPEIAIGGGIYNAGNAVLMLENVLITDNRANYGGAGIANVDNAVIYMSNTKVTANIIDTSSNAGGGIANRGHGKIWIQIAPNGDWLPGSSEIAGNDAGGAAAFINDGELRMVHTLVQGNTSLNGWNAIANGGFLSIVESRISGNGTGEGYGGAMLNYGTLEFVRSLMYGNSAMQGTGGLTNSGRATITNSTIAYHNTREDMGAVHNGGVMTITNSSIVNSYVQIGTNGTGFAINNLGTLKMANTLVGNVTERSEPYSLMTAPNCAGNIISLGGNISTDNTCAFSAAGDQNNVELKLSELADNGGPTLTFAPLPDSPAIDAGDNAQCPATDQRGEARPQDGNADGNARCDSGAYEVPFTMISPEITLGTLDYGSLANVTSDAQGNFRVIWANRNSVFIRRFSANGTEIGSLRTLPMPGSFGKSSIAGLNSGNMVIVWSGTASGFEGNGIFAQRFTSEGALLGNIIQIASTSSTAYLAVAMTNNGNFIATLLGSAQSGDPQSIYVRRYAADGTALGAADKINETLPQHTESHVQIATDAVGNYVVAWQDTAWYGTPGNWGGVYAHVFAADGTAKNGKITVGTFVVENAEYATLGVGMDAVGNFVVTWSTQDIASPNHEDAFARRFAANGQPLSDPFMVHATAQGVQRDPRIGMSAGGRFVIVWTGTDQDGGGIFAQLFEADGRRSGSEFLVNFYTQGRQILGNVSMISDKRWVFTWDAGTNEHGVITSVRSWSQEPLPVTSEKPTITIIQDSQPRSIQDFAYYGPFGKFFLDDTETDDADGIVKTKSYTVAPGIYNFAQGSFPSWALMDIQCTGSGQITKNMAKRSVAITVNNGDQMNCTFVSQRRVTIEAIKFNDLNGNGAADAQEPTLTPWEFRFFKSDGSLINHKVTDANGTASQKNMAPGSFKVCETPKAGWTNTLPSQLDPLLGLPCYSITLQPGQNASLLFGNTQSTVVHSADEAAIAKAITLGELPDINEPESEDPAESEIKQQIFLPLIGN